MPPTCNPQNNTFSDLFDKYSNIKYNDGFMFGFITGVSLTSILFSIALQSKKILNTS